MPTLSQASSPVRIAPTTAQLLELLRAGKLRQSADREFLLDSTQDIVAVRMWSDLAEDYYADVNQIFPKGSRRVPLRFEGAQTEAGRWIFICVEWSC